MNKNIQTVLGVALVLAIAGLTGFYIYSDFSKSDNVEPPQVDVVVSAGETATSTDAVNEAGKDKGYTVEVVPIKNKTAVKASIAAPDLDRKIVFGSDVSKDAQKIITTKINSLEDALKKDNSSLENWIDLGLYRKIAGDYEGARDAWEYVGVISPQNSLSFRNLGDLYGYYLKDSQKAEKNLLKAIENGPNRVEYYFKTVEFYREVMKDNSKARGVAQQGVKANPDSKNLKDLLASLK